MLKWPVNRGPHAGQIPQCRREGTPLVKGRKAPAEMLGAFRFGRTLLATLAWCVGVGEDGADRAAR